MSSSFSFEIHCDSCTVGLDDLGFVSLMLKSLVDDEGIRGHHCPRPPEHLIHGLFAVRFSIQRDVAQAFLSGRLIKLKVSELS